MMYSRYLELPFISKLNYLKSNINLTNNFLGVFTVIMHLSNINILNKLLASKNRIIKTGIILSLTTYWGVILVGTFITFN